MIAAILNDLADLKRRMSNMLRVGVVQEVNHAAGTVRVVAGGLRTEPLPWLTARAGANGSTWAPPAVGEQVLILSPYGDMASAVALPALYSAAAPAPDNAATGDVRAYPDGARIAYDTATHKLTATLPGGSAEITAAAVSIDAAAITLTGSVQVQGTVTSTGDVTAGGISLMQHVHGGVQGGPGTTSTPQ